jgi:hypothetical protein
VVRRSSVAATSSFLLVALALLTATPASAQQTAGSTFAHDASRDDTPAEIVSGFGGDPEGDPLAGRAPNTYETFPVTVPAGEVNGSLTARVEWASPLVDFDIYLYRQRPDGSLRPGALASSAAGGTTSEELIYRSTISSESIAAGTYVLVVDNWCSSSTDPLSVGNPNCAGVDVPDEDNFTGSFSFGPGLPSNPLPSVTLAGPDAGRPGDVLTYTATASDANGRVVNYAWDFDDDGRFELDRFESTSASRRFDAAGTYNVGVRVTDDQGGVSYASKAVVISAAASPGSPVPPSATPPINRPNVLLSNFALSRPAFGGRTNSTLTVRFRLRGASRVVVSLYRGSQRVRQLSAASRAANRTYFLRLSPRGLRDGAYTVLLDARTADGRKQLARLRARKL